MRDLGPNEHFKHNFKNVPKESSCFCFLCFGHFGSFYRVTVMAIMTLNLDLLTLNMQNFGLSI